MQRSASFQWGSQDGCSSPGAPTSCPVGYILGGAALCASESVPAGNCVIVWPGTSPCGSPGDSCGCSHWWYYPSDFVTVYYMASCGSTGGECSVAGSTTTVALAVGGSAIVQSQAGASYAPQTNYFAQVVPPSSNYAVVITFTSFSTEA